MLTRMLAFLRVRYSATVARTLGTGALFALACAQFEACVTAALKFISDCKK